jgi:hypothetical protein
MFYSLQGNDPLKTVSEANCTGKVEMLPYQSFFSLTKQTAHHYLKKELINFGVCKNCFLYVSSKLKKNKK